MQTRILMLLGACLLTFSAYTQDRSCGMAEHMELLLQDEEYAKDHQEKMEHYRSLSNGQMNAVLCSNPTILPVAVHFESVANTSAANVACLFALAENQIQTLNADYQGTNSEIATNWTNGAANTFPNVSLGETCIEFCLGTTSHPTGYGLVEGDYAVTINQFTGDSAPAFTGYINIFVRNIGFLGYSPLGGTGNGDGVVIDNNAFGSTAFGCTGFSPGAPYNKGRTLTHEMGHYLTLDHIWGNVGCNGGDGIGDTPNQTDSYGGCPTVGTASCGSADLHMSYMDYTNDACMYMFSAGQSTAMENYALGNAMANVRNNAASTCTAVNTCPVFLNLTANVASGTQVTQVQNYITSTANLTSTSDITYEAGNYIDLLPGFTQSNTNFLAHIIGCTPFTSNDDNLNFSTFEEGQLDATAVLDGQAISIDIQTVEDSPIEIELFDRVGNKVLHLKEDKIIKAGQFHLETEEEFAPGMYFLKVKTRTQEVSRKLIFVD